jgi:DNA-binding NtrC family response regulator
VRIIAATNRTLEDEVKKKTFREDLFYRLNVIPIYLPPLRERQGDIPHLVEYFLGRFCRRHRLPPPEFDEDLMDQICRRQWPGNIRELQNAVEKAIILQDATVLSEPLRPIGMGQQAGQLPAPPQEPALPAGTPAPAGFDEDRSRISGDECVVDLGSEGSIRELSDVAADAQREAVIRALKLCRGNKAEAAKKLGVSYKTLYNRINELGISLTTHVE